MKKFFVKFFLVFSCFFACLNAHSATKFTLSHDNSICSIGEFATGVAEYATSYEKTKNDVICKPTVSEDITCLMFFILLAIFVPSIFLVLF